jgi:hypothetical protein
MLDPTHIRHPPIDQKQGDWFVAEFELLGSLDRGCTRISPHDPKSIAILLLEISRYGLQYFSIVINGYYDWLCHRNPLWLSLTSCQAAFLAIAITQL